jgi:hypothetical protein
MLYDVTNSCRWSSDIGDAQAPILQTVACRLYCIFHILYSIKSDPLYIPYTSTKMGDPHVQPVTKRIAGRTSRQSPSSHKYM